MRIPTFSRQPGSTTSSDDEPTLVNTPAVPVRERDDTPGVRDRDPSDETAVRSRTVTAPTTERISAVGRTPAVDRTAPAPRSETSRTGTSRTDTAPRTEPTAPMPPVIAGPRPRASLLATLGLLAGAGSALLVLSGPLAGYGVGLAGLALVLSLGGISATSRRHVAGKSDAILGMILALAAIVVGVLALTGSLSWLGTDTDSASRLRDWLDTQFAQRF